MCNSLHHDSKPIPESGVGYKIMDKYYGEMKPVFGGKSRYWQGDDGWIKWKPNFYWDNTADQSNYGFCFFRTKKGAERLLADCRKIDRKNYTQCLVKKIEYRKGLGCHEEGGVITGKFFTTSICKEFRILE